MYTTATIVFCIYKFVVVFSKNCLQVARGYSLFLQHRLQQLRQLELVSNFVPTSCNLRIHLSNIKIWSSKVRLPFGFNNKLYQQLDISVTYSAVLKISLLNTKMLRVIRSMETSIQQLSVTYSSKVAKFLINYSFIFSADAKSNLIITQHLGLMWLRNLAVVASSLNWTRIKMKINTCQYISPSKLSEQLWLALLHG